MIIDLTTKIEKDSDAMKWIETQENKLRAAGHVGTHLDTYCKSDIPIEYFKSSGVLIDVSEICCDREVEPKDLEGTNILENSFVVFRTSHIDKFEYGTKDYFNNHPQLSHKLIDFLLDKKINFIGIDCSGIRRGQEHQPADRLCESKGVYVIENLSNLQKIGSDPFTVYTMWLDDSDLTGLRCRVIVEQ
ncbi:cyclase family protein [Metaclostridioides mangenotii]|uniref:cyclase family protein n=1 Tax=Metaclostridioides mangenotii TaxID=1540 RepID=UPI0028E883B8|nr:cyclase family protein [Clostridioides mangenotii]